MRTLAKEKYEAVRKALQSGMTCREAEKATGVSRGTINKIARGYVPQQSEPERVYRSVPAYFCRGCRNIVVYKPRVVCEAKG